MNNRTNLPTMMNRLYYFAVIFISFIIYGCASLEAPIERRVEGNIFHSEKYPKLRLKVSDDLPFISHQQHEKKPETDTGAVGSSNVKYDLFLFGNKKEGRYLRINIGFIFEKNWFFNIPELSQTDGLFQTGDEYLLDKKYSTAVYPRLNNNGWVYLDKVWGRVAGDALLVEIIYSEVMSRAWIEITTLNEQRQMELEEFIERAANSFEVIP